mmetsp:Transcript_60248/g.137684  ORF Transcript_60248/g.137684 Transcript_60248/m.137684 type:complete len:293 (-) Transcript_60248:480-1358(-)
MRQPHQAHSAALKRQMDELVDLEGDDSEVAKARLRVIKNRLAAQKSRETARHYVQNLEHSLSLLGTESQLLAARLAKVEQENAQLRAAQTIPGRPQGAARPEPPARRPSSGGGRRQETTETEGTSREPAALSPSSLQLDALLLLVSVAARLLPPSALRRPGALLRLALRLAAWTCRGETLPTKLFTNGSTSWPPLPGAQAGGRIPPHRHGPQRRTRHGPARTTAHLPRAGRLRPTGAPPPTPHGGTSAGPAPGSGRLSPPPTGSEGAAWRGDAPRPATWVRPASSPPAPPPE